MTKTKTSISLCGLAALAMCAFTVRPAGEQPIRIILNGKDTGKMFEGIGAASGGGAVSRLLINYPEPQRSQILDYFFKPNYGASLQHLKVEIGGDGNSTEGSEPSHMHRANDENYSRGFEWWVMKEAKKRNPNIKLHVLAWDFPAWVKEVNSQTAADYLVKYIEGVKKIHGLDIDTIGIWNETKTSYEFTRRLKRTLLAHHLKTQVSADDLVNTWEIAEAMAKDPELRDSVDVVNTHYPRFQSTPLARSFGKPVWSTEDGPWHDDWGCGGQASGPYAEVLNRNYVEGRITATILWCLVSSYYDILDVPNAGLLRAAEPWSGRFQVMSPLWIVAHTTQFAQPGWQYLDKATGLLPKGGSYVTLKQGANYSTVIETIAATEPQELSFTVQDGLSTGKVYVWRTNRKNWFERIQEITPVARRYTLQIDADSVYTLTTTTGQHKGSVAPPPERPFPMPYRDDFEHYAIGNTTPNYFIEQNGAYEVVACAGGRPGKCLRQVVNESPIVWGTYQPANLLGTASIIGDKNWNNYTVSADLYLEEPGYGRVMGRVSRATLDGEISGYQLYVYETGRWGLRTSTKEGVIASGSSGVRLNQWHTLALTFHDDRIFAAIDGQTIADVRDSKYFRGMAGFGNNYNYGQYDKFEIRPLGDGVPVFAPPRPSTVTAPPAPPDLFVPTPLDSSVRLTWSEVEGATGYKLRMGTAKGDYRTTIDAGALTSYKVWTLTNGQPYYFVVVAYNAHGESKPSGEMSAVPGR